MQRSASFYSNCCRYQICVCRSASCELKKVQIATHLISDCVFAQGITKLEHLNLSHMGLQDQDLNHIQGWTPNVLHTLDLRANQLTSLPNWLGSKQFGSLKKLLLFCSARDRKWVVVGGGGCLCLAGGESGAVERGMACEGVGREGARSSPTTLHIAQSFIESRVRAYGPEPCQVLHEGGEEEEGGDRDWLFCCAGRGTGPAAAPGRGTQSVPVRAPRDTPPEHQEQKRSLQQQLAALERKVTALKTDLAEADARLDLDTATLQSVGGEALQALLAAKREAFSQRWRQWSEEEVADWVGSLEQGRFAQLVACFRENGIDGKELAALENMTNLTDCGVKRLPDRRALWVHLRPLLGLDAAGRSNSKVAPQAIPERPAAPADCAVCMARPVEVVFAPCGHRCCRAECATELRQGGRPCPICRVKIESVVQRVFD
eukprot:g63874.t1